MAGQRFTALLILLPLALTACHRQERGQRAAAADTVARVPCALHGTAAFNDGCTVDRIVSGDGLTLVIHHPDGGFRRLLVATDGRGVVTADGSESAVVSVVDPGTIEVVVGDDRYRLPATVKGQALPER